MLVVVGDQLYVTDGGQNLVWQADIPMGAFTVLTNFPPIANPLFPTLGGPFADAAPTGIAYSDGQLLVTLFSGFPLPSGASAVEQVVYRGRLTLAVERYKRRRSLLRKGGGSGRLYGAENLHRKFSTSIRSSMEESSRE